MRLCHYLILTITFFACLQYRPSSASTVPIKSIAGIVEVANANSDAIGDKVLPLRPGSKGAQVKIVQTQLKELGYYEGSVDGKYGGSTKNAVSKFQSAQDLSTDGVVGRSTRDALETAVKEKRLKSSIDASSQSSHITAQEQGIFGWSLIAIGFLGSTGAILYMVKFLSRREEEQVSYFYPSYSQTLGQPNTSGIKPSGIKPQFHELDTIAETFQELEPPARTDLEDKTLISGQEATAIPSRTWLSPEQNSHITQFSVVDRLITNLHSPDPQERRKAIWDLGQEGDSRAIQPLTELMVGADSQERSLILGSLSEIGSRTLKPMNQALAISLQDESPQVRQNAIRDITRVYDMMAQISQIISHAIEDENPQVQETARYALSQMNRIRSLTDLENFSQELEETEIDQRPSSH